MSFYEIGKKYVLTLVEKKSPEYFASLTLMYEDCIVGKAGDSLR